LFSTTLKEASLGKEVWCELLAAIMMEKGACGTVSTGSSHVFISNVVSKFATEELFGASEHETYRLSLNTFLFKLAKG